MQIGLQRLRAKMVTVGADGVLVTKPENMQYFSGFSGGEGALVITEEKAVLITDFRYTVPASSPLLSPVQRQTVSSPRQSSPSSSS